MVSSLSFMDMLFLSFFFVALRPKSTAMVIAGRSVHLTTLFSWASLNKQLTSNRAHTFACNWQQPFLNDSFSGREENDRRNYFMINLHESMGPGRDRTRDPWICSQLLICNQTRYRLRYAARLSEMCNEKILKWNFITNHRNANILVIWI